LILIITHKEDFTTDFLINILNKKSYPYLRFNCEDIDEYDVYFDYTKSLNPVINGIETFKSVWYRRTKYPALSQYAFDEQNYLIGEYGYLLTNILENLDCPKWISHPNNINIAENKILQLREAQKIGLKIPKTLIANTAEKIIEFASKINNEKIIIKPLHSGRVNFQNGTKLIYSNVLNAAKLKNLDQYHLTPCIYQEYIDKLYELRITVVNESVFAAKVDSQANSNTKIDWRKEKLAFSPYNLPDELSNKCIELTKSLGLNFGAIDMIRTKNGYVFLEINPNGQWAWIEMDTKLPISNAIINYLYE
jgi:glutathione synthase/RimK-type ligase-like ATP-grasp enzyme